MTCLLLVGHEPVVCVRSRPDRDPNLYHWPLQTHFHAVTATPYCWRLRAVHKLEMAPSPRIEYFTVSAVSRYE